MLDRDFDAVLVGSNLHSYFLAIPRILKGEKILIIDDDRVQTGYLGQTFFSSLEYNFIDEWSRKIGFLELDQLDG
ncbi:MAG: hypothetical protein ACOCUH_02525, partial [Bacteriovoracia bacterium]